MICILIIHYKKKYNISGTYKTMGYCKEEKGEMVKKVTYSNFTVLFCTI